jgi:Kef-type K+ transport system membrane component KefB
VTVPDLDFANLLGVMGVAFAAPLALGFFPRVKVPSVVVELLVGITLAATSVGVVVPVLKDARHIDSQVGRLTLANSSIAEFMTVALVAVFFSTQGKTVPAQLTVLAIFVALTMVLFLGLNALWRQVRYVSVLNMLRNTTAQLRIRAAIMILLAAVVLAGHFGLETVLGAFMAGAILSVLHRGWTDDPELFRTKLDAVAFGFFVPVFFVTSGLQFDLDALFRSPSTILRVPLYVVLLLVVRGLPALFYRGILNRREVVAAGLLQATSLSFILVAVGIGGCAQPAPSEPGGTGCSARHRLKAARTASRSGAATSSSVSRPVTSIVVRNCSRAFVHPSHPARCASRRSRSDGASAPSR